MVKPGAELVGTGLHPLTGQPQREERTMADPRKPTHPTPAPRVTTETAGSETAPMGDKVMSLEEQTAMRTQLTELQNRNKKMNRGIRKLAAAILTPPGEADQGGGRRNAIAQSVNELVQVLGFEEEE
jgi:hypothetical protein